MEGEEAGGEVPGAFAGEGGDFRRGGGLGGDKEVEDEEEDEEEDEDEDEDEEKRAE